MTDDVSLKIMDIFKQEKANKATGGPSVTATMRSAAELAYQKKVENLLVDENCYKIYIVRFISTYQMLVAQKRGKSAQHS